jgi:uncharacterized protein with ParB-like and HNH nuclease domain
MSKKISGSEYPLAKIFSSEFDYVIPSYQRPYAWTVDESSELFDDLLDFHRQEQEDGYFLGSIVIIKEESNPYSEVIDGQQRLTTLTILLAAITSQLNGSLKTDFENYIREPGRVSQGLAPKPRLALRERDREFFSNHIQSLKFDDLLAIDPETFSNEAQHNIQINSKLLLNRLHSSFSGDEKQLCGFGSFIVQRCFLVAVSTPSQKSAFRVFSVMNSRGLDLLPTDIIKADVIGNIPKENQDEYTERWEDMEVQAGRNGFNDLFSHIRMIYAKEKAKKAILDEFKSHVLTEISSSESLIGEVLEPYTEAFMVARKEQYVSTMNAHEVNILLKWLNRIDNSDWLPPAILFLSKKHNDPAYVLWFFEKLERLAACLHVCAKNINQRIERYAQVLLELQEEHSLEVPIKSIELTDSEKEEMREALDGQIYALTARRRNYLILRLDSFLSDGAATYDPSVLTIEHVLPQTIRAGSAWLSQWSKEDERKAWVHRIANLVPLTQKRNSQAQNYDFNKKKNAYFGGKKGVSSYVLTTQVLNTETWTPQTIQSRQNNLLNILADKWQLGTI